MLENLFLDIFWKILIIIFISQVCAQKKKTASFWNEGRKKGNIHTSSVYDTKGISKVGMKSSYQYIIYLQDI